MLSLVVHGGAWDIPDNLVEPHKKGVEDALLAGWEVLRSGGSAVDAVETAVVSMENDEVFDAGRGSFMNSAGEVELDASIMDGASLHAGGVAAVKNVRNPVSLARAIMERSEHVLLVGMGATRFARDNGIPLCTQDDLIVERELARWREIQRLKRHSIKDVFRARRRPGDTVGAVARDGNGNLASATSTGGVPNKHPGRVGDSPLIGCGTYADNEAGAVSATGWGESMIRVVMAKTVVDLMSRDGKSPALAGERGIEILRRKANGYGGVIIIDPEGKTGVAYNTPRMVRGIMTSGRKKAEIAI
jgi:beta-aspartyl-peptidase (threonine type)